MSNALQPEPSTRLLHLGRRRSLSARPWDLLFFTYFALHIPISLLMDFQALAHYPVPPLVDLARWYTATFGDVLMRDARANAQYTWFWSFVVCELVVQLPVFVFAAKRLWDDQVTETVRMVLVVYGAHVSTTLVPILATVCSPAALPNVSLGQRVAMVSVYCPFLVVPMTLVWRYGFQYQVMVNGRTPGGKAKGGMTQLSEFDVHAKISERQKQE